MARRQAITWSNAGVLWISPLQTNLSDIWINIQNKNIFINPNAFQNVVCVMAAILSSGKWVNLS